MRRLCLYRRRRRRVGVRLRGLRRRARSRLLQRRARTLDALCFRQVQNFGLTRGQTPKARQSLPAETNGKPKTNGNASASIPVGSASAGPSAASLAARNRVRDSNGRWRKANTMNGATHASNTPSASASTGTRAGSARIRNRSARAREAAEAAENGSHVARQNGASPHPNGRSASSASMRQGEWYPCSHAGEMLNATWVLQMHTFPKGPAHRQTTGALLAQLQALQAVTWRTAIAPHLAPGAVWQTTLVERSTLSNAHNHSRDDQIS